MERRRALLALMSVIDNGLEFPVYLIRGNNGELGIKAFNYFTENYSFGVHTLDDSTQVLTMN